MMIKEQPTQLFYDSVDIRNATSAGFWSGVLTAGTICLVAVGALVMFIAH